MSKILGDKVFRCVTSRGGWLEEVMCSFSINRDGACGSLSKSKGTLGVGADGHTGVEPLISSIHQLVYSPSLFNSLSTAFCSFCLTFIRTIFGFIYFLYGARHPSRSLFRHGLQAHSMSNLLM